jgi:hypothetical protein
MVSVDFTICAGEKISVFFQPVGKCPEEGFHGCILAICDASTERSFFEKDQEVPHSLHFVKPVAFHRADLAIEGDLVYDYPSKAKLGYCLSYIVAVTHLGREEPRGSVRVPKIVLIDLVIEPDLPDNFVFRNKRQDRMIHGAAREFDLPSFG